MSTEWTRVPIWANQKATGARHLENTLQSLVEGGNASALPYSPPGQSYGTLFDGEGWDSLGTELPSNIQPEVDRDAHDYSQPLDNLLPPTIAPAHQESPRSSIISSENHIRHITEQTAASMNAEEKDTLLRLYFEHIQPAFPMFRKTLFYDELSVNMIPPALLLSMFAVSSRFAGISCYTESSSSDQPQEYFDAAYKEFRQEMDRNRPVELNDVKTACLLALYDYTSAPSRRAWLLVRDAMSLALAARLHEVDSVDSLIEFSDPEKEERRFVWWTIWKLDSTVNVSTVTPFGIDCRMIGTALVSTTVQNFTADTLGPIVPVIPEMDPVKSWTSILAPNLQDTGDGFNTHLFAVSLLRAVSECQQRLNAKLCPEEIARADTLNRILSSLHLILPDSFFSPTKRLMEQEHAHRLRLETNIMLNTARLILHEPTRQIVVGTDISSDSTLTSLKSWKDSIGFARKIASLFDHWQFSYSAYADPVISCALWHAYCGLRLYGMSGLDESGSSFSSPAAISLEKLRLSLESFTPWWPIARVLRDSLQALPARSWSFVDISKLVSLIGLSRKAFNPYRSDSEKVDVTFLLSYQ
ncbi:hypothetical protein PENCOP_c001G04889 [Penicillium coprophilum]|uniref:Xylanolytic transcriptional activator regulatory domain-containing protein n=1 Tax=Penicillium coprophilum TaxID=36646 RepID=A0A1V6V7B9_9EURO|nr:hypothetical protein PENCOP_c001G04889 [Penicillium coprophilum]